MQQQIRGEVVVLIYASYANPFLIWQFKIMKIGPLLLKLSQQEAQQMLTTGSTRLAVSRGQ